MRCFDCRKDFKKLQSHHLVPLSLGGPTTGERVNICHNCHEDRHGGPFGGILRINQKRTNEIIEYALSLSKKEIIEDWTVKLESNPCKKCQETRPWLYSLEEKLVCHNCFVSIVGWDINYANLAIGEKWTLEYDSCINCKTDRNRHASGGLCIKCYDKKKWQENNPYKNPDSTWNEEFPCCIECGKTESPKMSRGVCSRCYGNKRYAEKYSAYANFSGTEEEKEAEHKRRISEAQKIDTWSKKFDFCIECGGTESPHQSKGKCSRCYMRQRQREKNGYGEKPIGRPKAS